MAVHLKPYSHRGHVGALTLALRTLTLRTLGTLRDLRTLALLQC